MTDTLLPRSLSSDELDELDQILSDLGEREEIPQWEFCDGFLTALVCMRRRVEPAEYLPMLLDDGAVLDVEAGAPLPLLPAFQDAAQQERFLQLWQCRWDEVAHQLAADVQALDDEQTYQPHALDMRGAVAMLSEAERAEPWASCSPWRTGPRNGPRRATRRRRSGSTPPWRASSR